ncbi:Uma2 family endonuclease [Gloeobacter morelensis]|uniref:Uma2 family endonuclease n=1 Tax=Gloeobacter morelensis MG652769 TaxID=2781736 RepID=A0ABY3PIA0_9CYAN|nr:Uma2 family endonuclease [Gloeobacter morelensis]UFP93351.1 Uma2 family endonuclease [Gloeobacter morelensis MG652769]
MTAISPSQLSAGLPPLRRWHRAGWSDYVALRDAPIRERMKLAFDRGWLWVDMGGEGINHAGVSDLFTMIFGFWAIQYPGQLFTSLGRCLLEKPETQACAPDLVLYVGENFPRWQPGEPRRVDLRRTRVPDLVGEISDTTLTSDLDEQKHLYAALGIPEYWVVDVQGGRVFAFELAENSQYRVCSTSRALAGLPIALLEQALQRLGEGTNTSAATWFTQQIAQLPLAQDDSTAS